MGVQELYPIFQQFKEAIDKDPKTATSLLSQLKKGFVSLNSFLSITAGTISDLNLNEETKQEYLFVRETLEHAVILSAKMKDLEAFERNVNQVKSYYSNSLPGVNKSNREELILGLNLLRLLAQNRIAEFHTELELIPIDLHKKSMYIKHAIQMELFLMEGSYSKLRSLRDKAPAPEYNVFMDMMIDTIRKEIADCTELAYNRISLEGLSKLLLCKDDNETLQFIKSRQGWRVNNNQVLFENESSEEKKSFNNVSREIIAKSLHYAKDMERIV
ncbi:hypothetical protein ABK040_006126 [Willaertia magna]